MGCKTESMGLFSKRRSKGFDPDLWSDAKDRAKGKSDEPWFAALMPPCAAMLWARRGLSWKQNAATL